MHALQCVAYVRESWGLDGFVVTAIKSLVLYLHSESLTAKKKRVWNLRAVLMRNVNSSWKMRNEQQTSQARIGRDMTSSSFALIELSRYAAFLSVCQRLWSNFGCFNSLSVVYFAFVIPECDGQELWCFGVEIITEYIHQVCCQSMSTLANYRSDPRIWIWVKQLMNTVAELILASADAVDADAVAAVWKIILWLKSRDISSRDKSKKR